MDKKKLPSVFDIAEGVAHRWGKEVKVVYVDGEARLELVLFESPKPEGWGEVIGIAFGQCRCSRVPVEKDVR